LAVPTSNLAREMSLRSSVVTHAHGVEVHGVQAHERVEEGERELAALLGRLGECGRQLVAHDVAVTRSMT